MGEPENMTVLNHIVASIRDAATYNSHELAAPRVILWTDEDRLWAECVDSLRTAYPDLLSLGDFETDISTGPAVWLRYQLENHSGEAVPVIYLPGIGRHAFRSPEQFPAWARHLFALQYQGQFWTQRNGKDWTPFAFFSSSDGGLGLDVAGDQKTKSALQECLTALLKVKVSELRSGKLEAQDFREKLTTDPARTLLRWMNEPDLIEAELLEAGSGWKNFCELCREKYGFDPESDGVITAAEKLSDTKTEWTLVWERFKDAPLQYPGIKTLLGTIRPALLFEEPSEHRPLSNRGEESRLEADLLALESVAEGEARAKIKALASEHSHRSKWVWAMLGDSPLSIAIGHLKDAVDIIETSGSPGTFEAVAEYYANIGWRADRSILLALNAARSTGANNAVVSAVRAVYLPWLERMAEAVQAMVGAYPNSGPATTRRFDTKNGTAYIFADGLRMDMARGLEEKLKAAGLTVDLKYSWTALPSVTPTAKPAWMPLAAKLGGPLEAGAFQAKERSNGKALTHDRFKKLLEECGIQYLASDTTGSPDGCCWTEAANFDTYGHAQGAKLSWRVDEELVALQERIQALLVAGWTTVNVVTDHGWIMMPGGLPKVELPAHLTDSLWSRCVNPTSGAQHGFKETNWFWEASEGVVLAPGVSCFRTGLEYSHGGLTMQEAVIPSLSVTAGRSAGQAMVVLKELAWSGLRLNVVFEGATGLGVDIRTKVADPATSLVESPKTASADGQRTSLLVKDDEFLGTAAFIVVTDTDGQPIFKESIVIGEN